MKEETNGLPQCTMLPIWAYNTCRCCELDSQGLHGLVCKQAPSRIARHQAINDVVARVISTSGTPVMKEHVRLTRLDGKRPDGLTLIPWQDGKSLTRDVTVLSTLADSYLHVTSHSCLWRCWNCFGKEGIQIFCPSFRQSFATDRLRESRPAEWVGSWLPERVRSSLECFIPRSTRDLFSVPAAVSLDTALQLGADSWVILSWRRSGPLATVDVLFLASYFSPRALYSRGH